MQCTESGSFPVLENCALLLGSVHAIFLKKKKKSLENSDSLICFLKVAHLLFLELSAKCHFFLDFRHARHKPQSVHIYIMDTTWAHLYIQSWSSIISKEIKEPWVEFPMLFQVSFSLIVFCHFFLSLFFIWLLWVLFLFFIFMVVGILMYIILYKCLFVLSFTFIKCHCGFLGLFPLMVVVAVTLLAFFFSFCMLICCTFFALIFP